MLLFCFWNLFFKSFLVLVLVLVLMLALVLILGTVMVVLVLPGHRSTLGATMSVRGTKTAMAAGVTYDRYRPRPARRATNHSNSKPNPASIRAPNPRHPPAPVPPISR